MQLTLLAKDFYGSNYMSPTNCPVARACKRLIKGRIRIGAFTVLVNGRSTYKIDNNGYLPQQFKKDKILAMKANNDAIIRILNLLAL